MPEHCTKRNFHMLCAQAVADGRIKIMPDRFRTTYNRWLGGIRDWCISRQLWWGHRYSQKASRAQIEISTEP